MPSLSTFTSAKLFLLLCGCHRSQLCLSQAVQHKDYDIIAFETVPSLKEGQAIAHLLRTEHPGKPAWLTFNCRDTTSLSHGESFAKEAIPLAFEVAAVHQVPEDFLAGGIRSPCYFASVSTHS